MKYNSVNFLVVYDIHKNKMVLSYIIFFLLFRQLDGNGNQIFVEKMENKLDEIEQARNGFGSILLNVDSKFSQCDGFKYCRIWTQPKGSVTQELNASHDPKM